MPVMTAPALPLTEIQRVELQRMAVSTTLPHRKVVQAKALLWAGQGLANQEIARRCEVDSDAVRRWRTRFAEKGTNGVGVIGKGRWSQTWVAGRDGGRDRAGHLPREAR